MDTTTAECYTTQLIEGDGTFNGDELDDFIEQVKLAECGHSYVIVSIMGPQSSGKSTLLNHLFHTNFKEMNVDMGRTQTTQGIWIARCVGIEPCTIVMDIEGTDGQERGEDDTVFEKQSALFAMAVSDIVILNMWCHDIGREHASNKPLLKLVFEVRFAYDEEIINIKGRVGDFGYFGTHTVITSLTFVTNRATYGPYGNHNGAGFFIPEGIDFSLPLSKGRIIGFYGKSSIYLENFGVVLSS